MVRICVRVAPVCLCVAVLALLFATGEVRAYDMGEDSRTSALNILHATVQAIADNYYERLEGTEFLRRAQAADEKVKHSSSLNEAYQVITWVIEGLQDSHTQFIPPMRATRTDRGWTAVPVGDHCYINGVRPGSDAEAKGLRPGDELLEMDGFRITPETLSRVEYDVDVVSPHAAHELVILRPGLPARKLDVKVEFANLNPTIRSGDDWMELRRKWELDDEAMKPRSTEIQRTVLFEIPSFNLSDNTIDSLFKKAEKHDSVIFDLRDNLGGPQSALVHMLGHLFDHTIKICDRIGRKDTKPLMSKTHGRTFAGMVIVLLNGNSASSAEVFSRVIQLHGRGIVIGDRSAGEVTESVSYLLREGFSRVTIFGVQVSTHRLNMSDGQSLEGNPVVPDELFRPTQEDLAAGRDPVLAHAIQRSGCSVSIEEAASLFPHIWRKL